MTEKIFKRFANDVTGKNMLDTNTSSAFSPSDAATAPASAPAHDTTLPAGLLDGVTLPVAAVARGGYVWDETARVNVWNDEAITCEF